MALRPVLDAMANQNGHWEAQPWAVPTQRPDASRIGAVAATGLPTHGLTPGVERAGHCIVAPVPGVSRTVNSRILRNTQMARGFRG